MGGAALDPNDPLTLQMKQEYIHGATLRQLGEKFGMCPMVIRYRLIQIDTEMRPTKRPTTKPSKYAGEVLKMSRNGKSQNQIAEKFGVRRQAIAKILKRWA